MFGIKINNQWLDIDPKTSINITLHNPIFDKDHFGRIFSYNFKLPLSQNNKARFNYVHRLDHKKPTTTYEAQLFIQGILFENGILRVLNATDKFINVRFENKDRAFLEEIQDINIHEILETIEIPQLYPAHWLFEEDINVIAFNINSFSYNINGPSLGLSTHEVIEELINRINDDLGDQVNAYVHPTINTQFYIEPLNQNVDINLNTITGINFISSVNLSEAHSDSFYAWFYDLVNNPVDTHSFPLFRNKGAYEGGEIRNFKYRNFINYYINGEDERNEIELTPLWKYTYIPFVRLSYIFQKIIEGTSIENFKEYFSGRPLTSHQGGKSLVIYNNKTLDNVLEEKDGFMNGFVSSFNLNDHVPQLSAIEFFNKIADLFALYFTINDKALELRKKNEPLTGEPIDWTHKAQVAYTFEPKHQNGFQLASQRDSNDTATDPQLDPFIVGQGEAEHTTDIGTLPMGNFLVPVINKPKRVPFADQKVSSKEMGENPFSFRLLIDEGYFTYNLTDTYYYHYAHSDGLNPFGTPINNYSLDWQTPFRSLYDVFWKGYVEAKDGIPIKKQIRLSIQDILTIKKWENCMRTIYHENGQIKVAIKSLQFKVSQKGISHANIEFIKPT